MSKLHFAYNIKYDDIADYNYSALYETRRRDACFAGVIEYDGKFYAFRDHLGIIPLYYRYTGESVRFGMDFHSLIEHNDTLSEDGVRIFTKFSTARFAPLFEQIHIVPPASVIEIDPQTRQHKPIYQYTFQPAPLSIKTSWDTLVDQFKQLLLQALERTVQHDGVGLYLSGGIDSAIIAILLKELGVTVNGYTSGPWGHEGSDIDYAKRNAKTIQIAKHEFDFMDTSDYPKLMDETLKLFRLPKGIPTILGVTSLWKNTSISEEKQIFCGQNCDNIMGSMIAQYLTLFLQPLPKSLRKRLHPAFMHDDLIQNYLHLAKNYADNPDHLNSLDIPPDMNRVQQLIIAAMGTVGNSSSEVFTQPALMQNVAINNPYHDVDVVEFVMGLPFRRRLDFAKRGGLPIPILEKHLIQRLASRYLPMDVVDRKKAFTVPFERDTQSQAIFDNLPRIIFDIPLEKPSERFAGAMLERWMDFIQQQ